MVVAVAAVVLAVARPRPARRVRCPECRAYLAATESLGRSNRNGSGTVVERNLPEHALFLGEAVGAMAAYRQAHGGYAREWHQLHFPFVGGMMSFHTDDPGIYPDKAGGGRWRPRDSATTYRITSSGPRGFVIEALDGEGRNLHTVDQATPEPKDFLWP